MCFTDSNIFLYTLLYTFYIIFFSLSRFVLFFFFTNFSYSFCFFLEDFLIPFVVPRLNCLCGFNLILISGKHSLYKERKISRNLLYASLGFSKILILSQSILRNFYLNLSNDYSKILRLKKNVLLWNFSIYFVFCSKNDRKMV